MVEKTSSDKKFMKAVIYTAPGEYSYSDSTKEIPVPRKGQVLIKVEYGVINPTDTYYLSGKYNGTYAYPLVPGLEGSGTVVQSGGGFLGWKITGKRVAFTRINERPAQYTQGGSYAEYCVTNANLCIELDDNTSFEKGANGVINPLTALGLLDRCKLYKATGVIQTGANSQMGRMMIRLLRENDIPIINVVRKEEQIGELKKRFGEDLHVLNSESPTFEQDLKELAKKLNVNVVLECVAGPLLGKIFNLVPPKTVIISYGQLSDEKIEGLSPLKLLANSLRLESFLLSYWLKEKNIFQLLRIMGQGQRLLDEVIINKKFGLHQIHEAMAEYKANMGKGKVLLSPALTE